MEITFEKVGMFLTSGGMVQNAILLIIVLTLCFIVLVKATKIDKVKAGPVSMDFDTDDENRRSPQGENRQQRRGQNE